MDNNTNPISPELLKEIKQKALIYAEINAWSGGTDELSHSDFKEWDEDAYIAGATEYAQYKVKYEQAKDLLNKIYFWQKGGFPLTIQMSNEIKQFLDGSK